MGRLSRWTDKLAAVRPHAWRSQRGDHTRQRFWVLRRRLLANQRVQQPRECRGSRQTNEEARIAGSLMNKTKSMHSKHELQMAMSTAMINPASLSIASVREAAAR